MKASRSKLADRAITRTTQPPPTDEDIERKALFHEQLAMGELELNASIEQVARWRQQRIPTALGISETISYGVLSPPRKSPPQPSAPAPSSLAPPFSPPRDSPGRSPVAATPLAVSMAAAEREKQLAVEKAKVATLLEHNKELTVRLNEKSAPPPRADEEFLAVRQHLFLALSKSEAWASEASKARAEADALGAELAAARTEIQAAEAERQSMYAALTRALNERDEAKLHSEGLAAELASERSRAALQESALESMSAIERRVAEAASPRSISPNWQPRSPEQHLKAEAEAARAGAWAARAAAAKLEVQLNAGTDRQAATKVLAANVDAALAQVRAELNLVA